MFAWIKNILGLIGDAETIKTLWERRSLIGSIVLSALTVLWARIQDQPTSVLFVIGLAVFVLAQLLVVLLKIGKRLQNFEIKKEPLRYVGIGTAKPTPVLSTGVVRIPIYEIPGTFKEIHVCIVLIEHFCVASTAELKTTFEIGGTIKFVDNTSMQLTGSNPEALKMFGIDYVENLKGQNVHNYPLHFSPATFDGREAKHGRFMLWITGEKRHNFDEATLTIQFKNLADGTISAYEFEQRLKNPQPEIPKDVEERLRAQVMAAQKQQNKQSTKRKRP